MKNAFKVVQSMGGNTKRLGYGYLAQAAELIVGRGEYPLKKLEKEIYGPIAAMKGMKAEHVAREVARAVEEIWDHGNRERLEEILERKVLAKPSPGEMILGLALFIMKDEEDS